MHWGTSRGNQKQWSGGERGIRTPGGLAPTLVFKTRAINHSAISPGSALAPASWASTRNASSRKRRPIRFGRRPQDPALKTQNSDPPAPGRTRAVKKAGGIGITQRRPSLPQQPDRRIQFMEHAGSMRANDMLNRLHSFAQAHWVKSLICVSSSNGINPALSLFCHRSGNLRPPSDAREHRLRADVAW